MVTAVQHISRKRVSPWIEEAFEGVTVMEMLRALAFWRMVRDIKPGSPDCSWCREKGIGGMCKVCKTRLDSSKRAREAREGRKGPPRLDNLAERLERVEACLFEPNGVNRVEDGPFNPEGVRELVALSEGRSSVSAT